MLKASGADQNPAQPGRLRGLTADMPNVRIINRILPPRDLTALIRCADALISPHRAEGYGRFIAQAMRLGPPVVAAGWSGVMDMPDADNARQVRFDEVPVRPADSPSVPPGARLAEPDIGDAADCPRLLAGNPAFGRANGPSPSSVWGGLAPWRPACCRRPLPSRVCEEKGGAATLRERLMPRRRGQEGKTEVVRRYAAVAAGTNCMIFGASAAIS